MTVTDSDHVQNSTQATLLVNKATDYKPVANAGPNQVGASHTGTFLLLWREHTHTHDMI